MEPEIERTEPLDRHRLLKAGLLLLGAVFFAVNAAAFLHELGHTVGAWVTGGTVSGIFLHPFSWSYCFGSSPNHPKLFIWSGAILGSLFAAGIMLSLWRWRRPGLLFLLLIGTVACLSDGLYLPLGALFDAGGDGTILANLYGQKSLVIFAGSLLFLFGILLTIPILPLLGLRTEDSIRNRLLVFSIGILPYSAVTLIYQFIWGEGSRLIWVQSAAAEVLLIVLFTVLSLWIQRRSGPLKNIAYSTIHTKAVIVNNAWAAGLLILLMVLLPFWPEPSFGFTETRPEGFPEYLTAPEFAKGISYNPSSSGFTTISFDIDAKDKSLFNTTQQFLGTHLQEAGFHKIKYDFMDPNEPLQRDWRTHKSFSTIPEMWLNLQETSPKYLIISYVEWLEPQDESMKDIIHVILMMRDVDKKRVEEYYARCRELYPEEFAGVELRGWAEPNLPEAAREAAVR